MHISEGLLPITHCIGWGAVAAPFVIVASRDLSRKTREGDIRERALAGMAVAITFASTLLPLPVPGVGVTSHLCATPVLALLLGPRVMAAPAAVVLLLQALFFAHGGLTTLGANIVTLGIVGPWTAVALARALRVLRVPVPWTVGIACGLADVIVYVVDAGIVSAGVARPGSMPGVFVSMLAALALPQGTLAIVEGIVSALLLVAVARRQNDLVPAWLRPPAKPALALAVAATALMIALSPSPARAADTPPGLDETVFDATAIRAGRPPAAPLIDLGGGELTAMLLAFFAMGTIAGRSWQRLSTLQPESDRRSA